MNISGRKEKIFVEIGKTEDEIDRLETHLQELWEAYQKIGDEEE